MPRAERFTRQATVEALENFTAARRKIHVVAELLLHARRDEPGEPCPCCGSKRAYITRRMPIDEVLIHRGRGQRRIRSEMEDKASFDRKAASFHRVELPIRCADSHDLENETDVVDVLLDRESICTLVTGGNQSGKTSFGTEAWDLLRWLWYGGNGHLFRLMGYDYKRHAWTLAKKLFLGEGDKAPSFPRELWIDGPTSPTSVNSHFRMVDGSVFELIDAKTADKIKSVKVYATHWTEVTATNDPTVFTTAVARHLLTRGQILCETTPKGSHFIEEAAKGEITLPDLPDSARPMFARLTMASAMNPWADPVEVAAMRATAAALDPMGALRDFDGQWVKGEGTVYQDTWKPAEMVVDMLPSPPELGAAKINAHLIKQLAGHGYRDITPLAIRQSLVFRRAGAASRRALWGVGVDVNYAPHTAIPIKVITPIDADVSDDSKWGLYIHDEVRTWHADAYTAGKRLYNAADGIYRGSAIAIDASAAHKNQHIKHTGGRVNTTPMLDYQRLGFSVTPPGGFKAGKAQYVGIEATTALVKHIQRTRPFLVNATEAKGTIKAFDSQEIGEDGLPLKVPNTRSDREIASFMESVRYIVWAIFAQIVYERAKVRINRR